MNVGEIARWLGAAVEGDSNLEITGVQSLEDAGPHEISFVEGPAAEKRAAKSKAGCLLAGPALPGAGRTLIRVPAPRKASRTSRAWVNRWSKETAIIRSMTRTGME